MASNSTVTGLGRNGRAHRTGICPCSPDSWTSVRCWRGSELLGRTCRLTPRFFSHQRAGLQQPAKILFAGDKVIALTGFQVLDDLVADLQPFEMNNPNVAIIAFPDLSLLQFECHEIVAVLIIQIHIPAGGVVVACGVGRAVDPPPVPGRFSCDWTCDASVPPELRCVPFHPSSL